MDDEDDNKVVDFPTSQRKRTDDAEVRAATAAERAGAISKISVGEPLTPPGPRWAAIMTFVAISILALFVGVLSPMGPEETITWRAALAFIISILMGGGALLYRYSKEFWTAKP